MSRALLPTSERLKQTMKILLMAEILSKLDITSKLIVCLYLCNSTWFSGNSDILISSYIFRISCPCKILSFIRIPDHRNVMQIESVYSVIVLQFYFVLAITNFSIHGFL